jgi:hypothetical protein
MLTPTTSLAPAGTLPPSWGALTKLKICRLFNNTLSGPLPVAWSGMAALEDLQLSFNALTGGWRKGPASGVCVGVCIVGDWVPRKMRQAVATYVSPNA